MWDEQKFKTASNIVDSVFDNLEGWEDFYARRDWTCCNSCGWYELKQEHINDWEGTEEDWEDKKVVFYHTQETDSFKECGLLHLSWYGDWKEVKRCFECFGCRVEADGNENRKIIVDFTGESVKYPAHTPQ